VKGKSPQRSSNLTLLNAGCAYARRGPISKRKEYIRIFRRREHQKSRSPPGSGLRERAPQHYSFRHLCPWPPLALLPLLRAPSSHRVGFGRCSPSTTSTTPRTSPFPNPRRPLVSVSSRSRRIRKLLPQLCVCVSRLVTMVRIWCTRSLGRLNFLDLLLRHNALVGGHPGQVKSS
jgi:hypothetical protein